MKKQEALSIIRDDSPAGARSQLSKIVGARNVENFHIVVGCLILPEDDFKENPYVVLAIHRTKGFAVHTDGLCVSASTKVMKEIGGGFRPNWTHSHQGTNGGWFVVSASC